ncbi:MAG: hypothetical protein JO211_09320 [Acidobacteriaceae bacterium]|nr:hypothetical protein [Acidobacteriaceae bacterium]
MPRTSFTVSGLAPEEIDGERFSRRQILGKLTRTGILVAAANDEITRSASAAQNERRKPQFETEGISPEDDQFLEELERANVQFFLDQADAETGLVKDRCNVRVDDKTVVASIAATGFGLTALCIAHKRGYLSIGQAHLRVITALHFLRDKMARHRGFFYHFANLRTGERVWESEVSSIDTAILLCGVMTCHQYFRHTEITGLAHDIFFGVDWRWLSEDTTLLPQGWSPESGFLPYRWDDYSELMMIYLFGLGSSSQPLPADAWNAWNRPTFEYEGLRYIGSYAPLFVNQYSQAWFDFRGKRDRYADYFQNSIIATEVHRLFCLELNRQFPDYSDSLWGITASDSENGYIVWGGPPALGPIDGTVVPSAAAGSLPFLPGATLRVLKNMKQTYGARVWSRYGFVNAFNPLKNWYDTDVIGIDTGITMVMAENLRTGFVWNTFMQNREAVRGFERAGFTSYAADYTTLQKQFETRTT